MNQSKKPELVCRGGRPVAVILDIGTYREMLERLEDQEDLRVLEEMKKEALTFHSLEDVLAEFDVKV